MGRKNRQKENWVTKGKTRSIGSQDNGHDQSKTGANGAIHATFVKPMSHTPQTQAASGCDSVFSGASDNLPDRNKIVLHVQVSVRRL